MMPWSGDLKSKWFQTRKWKSALKELKINMKHIKLWGGNVWVHNDLLGGGAMGDCDWGWVCNRMLNFG